LGEIESVLQQSGLTLQTVVLARNNAQNNKQLVAYVVPNQSSAIDKEAIKSYLKSRLPEYMVPQIWVELESIPLTSNGKIDKKALPNPDLSELLTNLYVAPRNQTEATLVQIWQELLNINEIGINDNFFELGGDSILTIQLSSRAGRQGLNVQPKDIFIHQTIERLSKAISDKIQTKNYAEQEILTGEVGLIPIQQWYLDSNNDDVSHYNQSVLLELDKQVTQEELAYCFRIISAHHDGLRMQFTRTQKGWTQAYSNKEPELKVEDFSDLSQAELSQRITLCADSYQQGLDIAKGDIFRMVWIKTSAQQRQNRLFLFYTMGN
jgi:aryl carrier-like protein